MNKRPCQLSPAQCWKFAGGANKPQSTACATLSISFFIMLVLLMCRSSEQCSSKCNFLCRNALHFLLTELQKLNTYIRQCCELPLSSTLRGPSPSCLFPNQLKVVVSITITFANVRSKPVRTKLGTSCYKAGHVGVCNSLQIGASPPQHIQVHEPCATIRPCRCSCTVGKLSRWLRNKTTKDTMAPVQ